MAADALFFINFSWVSIFLWFCCCQTFFLLKIEKENSLFYSQRYVVIVVEYLRPLRSLALLLLFVYVYIFCFSGRLLLFQVAFVFIYLLLLLLCVIVKVQIEKQPKWERNCKQTKRAININNKENRAADTTQHNTQIFQHNTKTKIINEKNAFLPSFKC